MGHLRLNKLCEIEDWDQPALVEAMRLMEPDHVNSFFGYPLGREHRKSWEYAQLITGFDRLKVLHPEALVLSVAAGAERPVFSFTTQARWVFATDIYGTGAFSGEGDAAAPNMLMNPDGLAPFAYNRNRLVVQFMNALDLRHENDTFDAIFSLSSIEHFGGLEGAKKALAEMHRVLKPGGVVMLTTECIVNGEPEHTQPDLALFTPEMIRELAYSVAGLTPVEEIDFTLSDNSRQHLQSLEQAIADAASYQSKYPHLVLECAGRHFTSISLFWRKAEAIRQVETRPRAGWWASIRAAFRSAE